MEPGTYSFKVYPGADVSLSFAVTGMDLTGYTGRSKMRAIWDASIEYVYTVALTYGTGWTIAVTSPGAETTGIKRPPTSAPSDKVAYYWDLELVSPGGQIYRFLQGTATVFPEATR